VTKRKIIYLDNSATSYPKPKSVLKAMERVITTISANPGRSGYGMANKSDRLVYDCRKRAGKFFGMEDASKLIYTPGGTYSLNMAIRGTLKKNDSVVSLGREHNAVARVLREKSLNLKIATLKWDGNSAFVGKALRKLITKNTKAIVVTHASNVDGLLFPLTAIGKIASDKKIPLIIDAAQSAGVIDIDMSKLGNALLCVTGHKGLWSPLGIGILALSKDAVLSSLIYGGTGSFSDDLDMPTAYPDRLEAGSLNLAGIAGLDAGIREVQKKGVKKIFKKKTALCDRAFIGLKEIDGVKIYRPLLKTNRVPLFSFYIKGIDPSKVGDMLDRKYGIACRVGLHCAPFVHRELGTSPEGLIRFAPGFFTTAKEIDIFIKAVAEIAKNR